MKKRIGILTYHHTTNYGAVLQAYALQTRLRQLGYPSEIIDYRPNKAVIGYARVLLLSRRLPFNVRKYLRILSFLRHYTKRSRFPIRTVRALARYVSRYNVAICGSDEIWKIGSFRGYDQGFFAPTKDTARIRKCSFAASVGPTDSFGALRDDICQALSGFEFVSVRDYRSRDLLLSECRIQSVLMPDPTFLVDFNDLTEDCSAERANVFLIYGSLSLEEQNFVRARAAKTKHKVVSTGEFNRLANKNMIDAGVLQWLRMFAQADEVYTTFFHGVVFALIYDRPLTVFERPDKSYKLHDLCHLFEIDRNPLTSGEPKDSGVSPIQYRKTPGTQGKIADLRQRADRYLLACLQ